MHKRFRWSKVYESSEEELTEFLKTRNILADRIACEPMSETSGKLDRSASTLWCAEGSLSVRTDTDTISLQAGDAVRLSTPVTYSLHAGLAGCVWYLSA